jgi:hypothetical protein
LESNPLTVTASAFATVSDFLSTPAAPDNATKYTVIATFKNLVVGATLLIPTSPQEVYIAYLVVRAGWEGNGVAT